MKKIDKIRREKIRKIIKDHDSGKLNRSEAVALLDLLFTDQADQLEEKK